MADEEKATLDVLDSHLKPIRKNIDAHNDRLLKMDLRQREDGIKLNSILKAQSKTNEVLQRRDSARDLFKAVFCFLASGIGAVIIGLITAILMHEGVHF